METFRKDLQLAVRMLAKNPGFTSIAVLTLALGIAVNATMFSMVSAYLLRLPAGRDPYRVAVVTSVNPGQAFLPDAFQVSAPNYLSWREANHVFADLAAADEFRTVSLAAPSQSGSTSGSGSGGQPEALSSAAVSPNYFSVLDAKPQLGRTFEVGEDQPGRDHVVILSHDLWVRRFGSDPAILQRILRINRENYNVVGVMPANFRLMGFTPQLWTPLVLSPADQTAAARKDHSLYLFGRLKPNVTLEQARAEMVTLAKRAEESFPDTEKGWAATVRTLPDFLVYSFQIRNAMIIVMTTVGFVLMIACANVAGLLVARAAGRRKELAIRISLGAGRLRIVRQLLTEGVVIASLGGSLGLLLAYWGIGFLRASITFNDAVIAVPVTLDRNVLMFAISVSLLCALLSSVAPAWNAARTDVNANLKDESRAASASRAHSRLRSVMVIGEIALALCLLVGTGLLIHGIFLVEHQSLGFRAEHLLTANLSLDEARYKGAEQERRFVRDVLARLQQIPGAEAGAITSDLPATGAGRVPLAVKGQPDVAPNHKPDALDFVVTTDYFGTAGIPLLRGRTFTERDNSTAPRVVVVNQQFVREHLRDQEPLGKQIRLDVAGAPAEWSEIVGVVGNVKNYSEDTRYDPQVYESYLQRPVRSFSLMIRASGDASSLTSGVRDVVGQIDAELPLAHVMSMPALIDRQKGGDTLFSKILGGFAALALLLAAIGIYGLVAYSVSQRTHEIGIRMALGAGNGDVLRMVLWGGLKMTAIGAAIGLAIALPLPKVFEAMFEGLHFRDVSLYLLVPTAIVVVAMLATYVPARRATRVDPMRALRQE